MSVAGLERVGAVAIGRNEGDRLRQCLHSLVGKLDTIVYVDSGSVDGSVDLARDLDIEVVELDMSIPFTAARARNAGFERLLELRPDVELVQFVDGDCEVVSGWLERAVAELGSHPDVAVVCGRRRERHPDASIYNRLCDIEWDTPVGEALASGGDAMMRVGAFKEVGGFDPDVIAAEDDDICVRLRLRNWKILRVDAEMTLHDAAIMRFGQWWKRSKRAGHGYAQVAALHGNTRLRHFVRHRRSVLLWGGLLPLLILALVPVTKGLSVILIFAYVLLAIRIYMRMRHNGASAYDSRLYAWACVMGKFPSMLGLLIHTMNNLRHRRAAIIEYKGPTASL